MQVEIDVISAKARSGVVRLDLVFDVARCGTVCRDRDRVLRGNRPGADGRSGARVVQGKREELSNQSVEALGEGGQIETDSLTKVAGFLSPKGQPVRALVDLVGGRSEVSDCDVFCLACRFVGVFH